MKIIIVGLGNAGKHYLNLLKFKKEIELYVVDKKKLPKNKSYTQITFNKIKKNRMFFDSAIISSPSGSHFKHAYFFLMRNSNILIEKPFVLRLSHAQKLIKITKKTKKKCWTTFQNRHNLAILKLRKEIKEKKIGKINLVDCMMIWHRDEKYYKVDWRGKYSSDGGVLNNQAIHLLDILIYIFGEIKHFDVFASFNKNKLQAEDLIMINFLHKNGVYSSLKATTRADQDYRSAIDIIGSKGRLIVKGISLNTFNRFNKNLLVKEKKHSEEFKLGLGPISGMGYGHQKILNEFLSSRKKSSQNLEIEKNYYLLKVIHSIYNNITKRKKFNSIKNVKSVLG